MKNLKAKEILVFLVGLFFMLNIVKTEEGTCGVNRGDGTKSCGDDIIVEDDYSAKTDNKNSGREEKTRNKENKENTQHPNDNSANAKKEYYSHKKKPTKKPGTPTIEFSDDLKYENVFLQKGTEREEYLKSFHKDSNYTDYFDFSVTQEEMDYIKKVKYAIIPQKKFQFVNQGNFLHFYRIAYEKKIPVMFTVDSMLYSLIENVSKIKNKFMEEVYIILLKKTLDNIINYAETLKDNSELEEHKMLISHCQIFFGAGVTILSSGLEDYEGPADVGQYFKGVAELAKKFSRNTFGFMLKQRNVDTTSMMPVGKWRRSQRLANIWMTIRFYELFKLDLRDDIKVIWILGKLITDSGNKQIYNELKEMTRYFIGFDKNVPDLTEIYELGRGLGFEENVYNLSNEQIEKLSKKITNLVEGYKTYQADLGFTNDYILYSQQALDKFKYEKEHRTGLFFQQNDLEDWIKNKMITIHNQQPRLMFSSHELIDILLQGSAYRTLIFNRFKGKQSFRGDHLMEFRDNIDLQENFEKAKYSIKHSMEKQPEKWRKSLTNHINYLLYKSTRRIKHTSDPVFKSPGFKEKQFNTAWGAWISFKRNMIVMSKTFELKPRNEEGDEDEKGGIPEVFLEPHLEFYKEMKIFWNGFKERILQYILTAEINMKINYKMIKVQFSNAFQDMEDAIQICIDGIKMQESGTLDEAWRKRLRRLIYWEPTTSTWHGWYTNLADRDNQITIFNYDIWMSNIGMFPESEKFKFAGANLFNVMRFPQFSYIVVEDKEAKERKVLLSASYSVREYLTRADEEIKSQEISQDTLDRH